LDSVAWLLGGASLNDFIHKYRIKPTQATLKIVAKKYPGGGLRRLKPVRKVSHKLRDLMEKMLTFDHNDRIMASEALAHPYFQSKSVKNK
jgi:serine/threonine protein kinase